MPKSLVQECYMMFTAVTYQNLMFFLFLLHLMCASYGHELYRCFDLCHAIFKEVYAMYLFDLCGVLAQACKLGFVMFLFPGT